MKRHIITALTLVLLVTPAYAHHRYHHHQQVASWGWEQGRWSQPTPPVEENSMVGGIGHGLAHMLRSMEPHPAGCPWTAFCGCGVSVRVFGHPVRDLYLAANWYRYPRAARVPGNVIVRPHHVKYIESVENGVLMCYDPNSGGHLTRLQPCGEGGTAVNPRG